MKIWFYIGSAVKYQPKIKYTVDLFFSIYGLKCIYLNSLEKDLSSLIASDDLLIAYDRFERLQFYRELVEDRLDFFYWVDLFPQIYEGPFPLSFEILKKAESNEKIPILFNLTCDEKKEFYFIEAKDGNSYSGITWKENGNIESVSYSDLIASSYYFLALQEETHPGKKDKHGRFKAEFSFRKKEKLITYPLVNTYFRVLFNLIHKRFSRRNLPLIRKSFWPGGVPLAVVLTHDVDVLDKWFAYALFRGFQLLLKGKIGTFFLLLKKVCSSILRKINPAASFDFLVQMEKELNFSSTFFFLAGKPNLKTFLKTDVTYDINSIKNKKVFEKIDSETHEVGLHGSYSSFADMDKLGYEKKLLENAWGSSPKGIRQHFLRLDPSRTWRIQESLNFVFDCSLGYPDASGFRSGLAFPLYPFDDTINESIRILELNTNIMDQTYVKYDEKDLEEMKTEIIEILDRVEDYGGLVTLLWHSNVVDEFAFFGFMKTYQEILKYLKQKKAFVGTGNKITEWWQKREHLTQLSSSNSKDNIFEWEYVSGDFLEDATLELYFTGVDEYHIRAENIDIRTEMRRDFILVKLSGLKPNQKFKISLQKKDE